MSRYPIGHEGVEFRLEWEVCPKPEYRVLHCTWPVPQMSRYSGDEKMEPDARALRDKIAALAGVEEVQSYRRYAISILRSRLHPFSDICPWVVAIVCEFFSVAAPTAVADSDPEPVGHDDDCDPYPTTESDIDTTTPIADELPPTPAA